MKTNNIMKIGLGLIHFTVLSIVSFYINNVESTLYIIGVIYIANTVYNDKINGN